MMCHRALRDAPFVRLGAALFAALALLVACDRTPGEAPGQSSAPVDFSKHERKVFSQFGEDGILEEIFRRIEPSSRYAVEFGASDGVSNSNVRNLYLEHGWSGLLIEGDPGLAEQMRESYADVPRVETLEAWVFPGNIETLFEDADVPDDLDFLVIDIDSNHYWVWKVMHQFQPKVLLIEINPFFPTPQLMVIDFHPMNYWDNSTYAGASLESLDRLAKKKGYELVYVMTGGPNAFFVDAKYFPRFGIEDNSPTALWRRNADDDKIRKVREKLGGPTHLDIDAFQIEKKYLTHR